MRRTKHIAGEMVNKLDKQQEENKQE